MHTCTEHCERKTIGWYLNQPDVAARRARARAAARWRTRRHLHDLALRAPIEQAVASLIASIHRYRRLDAIAADLRALADRCDHAQAELDRELADAPDIEDQERLAS